MTPSEINCLNMKNITEERFKNINMQISDMHYKCKVSVANNIL